MWFTAPTGSPDQMDDESTRWYVETEYDMFLEIIKGKVIILDYDGLCIT